MAEARDREPKVRIGPYVYQTPPNVHDGTWAGPPPQPDSWDFDPEVQLPDVRYHGVRRADGDQPRRRLGLVLAVVGGLALLAVAIPLIGWLTPAADERSTSTGATSPGPAPSDAQVTESPVPTTAAAGTVAASPPVAGGAIIVIEAEASPSDVKRRGAIVVKLAGASGGQVVRLSGDSEIEWRGVNIPSTGTYRVTVSYAGEKAGSGSLTVANAAPTTVTFTTGSGCCLTAAVDVTIPAGRQSITLAVPGGGPAIDKIAVAPTP